MPRFRNTRTGRVADVPDEAPTRTSRPKRDKQWAVVIAGLDRSARWERVGKSAPAATSGPSTAKVRAWAREEGLDVPARGPMPDDVVERYTAAHSDG
jgi:hypothetical protein